MRLLLTLFGLVQIAVAIMLSVWSQDIVSVMVIQASATVATVEGVVEASAEVSPLGEPVVVGLVHIHQAGEVLWSGLVGDPQLIVRTRGGETLVEITESALGWPEVAREQVQAASLSPLLAQVSGLSIDGPVEVELAAIRRHDRVRIEVSPSGELSLWVGGATIGAESLAMRQASRKSYDGFLLGAILLTGVSGTLCIGWGLVRF